MPVNTIRSPLRGVLSAGLLLCALWLAGCTEQNAPMIATITLKRDGTHFSGTVVRRAANSITLTDSSGESRVFLYTELSDIEYGAPEAPTANTAGSAGQSAVPSAGTGRSNSSGRSGTASARAANGTVQFPIGTEIPVRGRGVFDSCCMPAGSIALGVTDADVKGPDGKVAIPEGANVTIITREVKIADGYVQMQFELGSADFNDQHYVISSAKGGLEPSAVVTFLGAKYGSPEAKAKGLHIHLEDQTYMGFKAVTPTLLKPSL